MRPGVLVRPAEVDDLPALVGLCLEARAESAVGSQLCTPDSELLRQQLGTFIGTPGAQVIYGLLDDVPAGLLLARTVGPSPFTDDVSLHVEALFVGSGTRRRGVGHALLEAALGVAEDAGAEHVYALPLPGARGMQRFLARLGFAPAAAHRMATLQALQRRLAADGGPRRSARRAGQRGLEHLIARRRQVREETLSGGLDSGAVLRRVQDERARDRAGQGVDDGVGPVPRADHAPA